MPKPQASQTGRRKESFVASAPLSLRRRYAIDGDPEVLETPTFARLGGGAGFVWSRDDTVHNRDQQFLNRLVTRPYMNAAWKQFKAKASQCKEYSSWDHVASKFFDFARSRLHRRRNERWLTAAATKRSNEKLATAAAKFLTALDDHPKLSGLLATNVWPVDARDKLRGADLIIPSFRQTIGNCLELTKTIDQEISKARSRRRTALGTQTDFGVDLCGWLDRELGAASPVIASAVVAAGFDLSEPPSKDTIRKAYARRT